MRRGIDFSSLSRAERLVLATGLAVFANGFIPWWYRIRTARGTFTYNAGLTGWGTIAVAAGALAVLIVVARAWIWPKPAPRADGTVYALLGVAAIGASLVQFATAPARWIGLYVALVLAAALIVAGFRRRQERSAGWV